VNQRPPSGIPTKILSIQIGSGDRGDHAISSQPLPDVFHMVSLITSKLVWDCHQSFMQLAKQHFSTDMGKVSIETEEQLARTGSEHPFIGPNQFAASQSELPRKRSGTGRTESQKVLGIHNWSQTGKGTYIRTLCQKN
jgi:hypothetical protein